MASQATLAIRSPKNRPSIRVLWGGNGLPPRTIGKGDRKIELTAEQAFHVPNRAYRRHPPLGAQEREIRVKKAE